MHGVSRTSQGRLAALAKMTREQDAKSLVDEFLKSQREMYAGGDDRAVEELLAADVVWHVPGTSPIAGDYSGREAVMGYFQRRRALAGGTIEVIKHQEMDGPDVVVQLADGRAAPGGRQLEWRTAGVYRVADGRIAEAWLVPLEQEKFEQAWRMTRPTPFVYRQRVRPQDCATSTMLGHPRLLEFFEAGFIEAWRERAGGLDESLGPARRLTVASVAARYLAPVQSDDEVRVDVSFDRVTRRSIQVHYDAFVEDVHVAEGSSRYVCLDARTREPTELPAAARRL
jgi:uncharacterized protein